MMRTGSTDVRTWAVFVLTLGVVMSSGCSVFLPPHANSFKSRGEQVDIKMLTRKEMTTKSFTFGNRTVKYADAYKDAFGIDLTKPDEAQKVAIAAAAAVPFVAGLAIDLVVSQLQTEATQYEAQFGTTKAFAGFWKRTNPKSQNLEQNYLGFEVTRTVRERDPMNPNEQKDVPAFKLVVGLAPSPDRQMFQVAPLLFWTGQAKAKALSDALWTWLPPMLLGKLVRTPGRHIDTTVDIHMEAMWRGADQQLHVSTVGAVSMKFTSYDLDTREIRTVPWGRGEASGWLFGVPVSYDPTGQVAKPDAEDGYGTFSLKVLVTEKDKSNAKQLIEQGAMLLKERKTDIIKQVTK